MTRASRPVVEVHDLRGLTVALRGLSNRGAVLRLTAAAYDLVEDLVIDRPNVTLRGVPRDGESVVIRNGRSDGQRPAVRVLEQGFRVEDVEFVDLTIVV